MANWLFEILRGYFDQHGYWTVFVALLLENAGIPVPGETILLFASFLAFSEQDLRVPYIILVGVAAATLGDNIGYFIGYKGGRRLLDRYRHFFRIPEHIIAKGEHAFEKHGSLTIFFARFVFGMRIVAGPLAGVMRMPWKRFVLFNFLGAGVWVTVITLIGYKFGEEWERMIKVMGRVNLVIGVIALYVGVVLWRRYRSRRREALAKAKAMSAD
jgi:membrane protein DedA with SNARE-associated domain